MKADDKWQVMTQNLRQSPCDSRCPAQLEIPIQPAGGGNIHAVVYGHGSSLEESRANCLEKALLIASAPELLDELRTLYNTESNGLSDAAMERISTLIDKATGQ